MRMFRRGSADDRLREQFSATYEAEAKRMLGLLRGQSGNLSAREVATIHRNTLKQTIYGSGEFKRMAMTDEGRAALRQYEADNLAALLRHTGISISEYAACAEDRGGL